MAEVAISKKATHYPTNVKLKRGAGNSMDLTFGIPADALWTDNAARISFIDIEYVFQASKDMDTSIKEERGGDTHLIADHIWVRDLGTSAKNHTQDYGRDKYHPLKSNRFLEYATATVIIGNGIGYSGGPLGSPNKASMTYTFQKPRTPEWSDPTYDTSTGKVSAILTAADDEEEYERYDTVYCITRQDNFNSSYATEQIISTKNGSRGWVDTRSNSVTAETLMTSEAQSITYGQWIKITFKAYSRGLKGDSATVTKSYMIAHPARPSITSITVSNANETNGLITVRMKSNESEYYPIDTVQLQRLSNTAINTVDGAKAAAASAWSDISNAVDDDTCTGFTDNAADARPNRGNHVWYRIKSVRGSLIQYSDPVKADQLERLSTPASDDVVTISSVSAGDDGESLKVIFGWSNDDSNGTEISWAEKADAWNSTEPPTTFNFYDANKDETSQVTGKPNSAYLVIRGLTEGTKYYIKARRFADSGDNIEYSDSYCSAPDADYPKAPTTKPSSVKLNVPPYVKRGSDLSLNWTYEGVTDQKQWNLYRITRDGTIVNRTPVASGDDSISATVVKSSTIETLGDSVELSVSITTGGDWAESDPVTVKIADVPTLKVAADKTLRSQPMMFSVSTDCAKASLISRIYSRGSFSSTPDGQVVQAEGDAVWGAKVDPEWYPNSDGRYYVTVTLPDKRTFLDGADYVLQCIAVDPDTGFQSEIANVPFTVDWAHQAEHPGWGTSIVVDAESKSAQISPSRPSSWAPGDVYDLYRVTNDSVDLIAEGVSYTMACCDRYAPFGKNVTLAYRVANRTKDGDVEWRDFQYHLKGHQLRFDWGEGQAVELPYNKELSDSYDKNYEAHTHLDGSRSGHWNPGYVKKGNFKTKLPKVLDAATVKVLRDLATYPAPVFVRTPDGGAFQANVTVSGLDDNYDDLLTGVSIKVESLTLSDMFRLSATDYVSVSDTPDPSPDEYQRTKILYWGTTAPQAANTYSLLESPVGTGFKVELVSSFDNFGAVFQVPATYSGATVTLGTFGAALTAYIQQASAVSGTEFILTAYYNV